MMGGGAQQGRSAPFISVPVPPPPELINKVTEKHLCFPGRAAVKGSCVTASPPGIPPARKHGELKEICADTAVSEHTLFVL